jgi:serine/threonine-protein kinase HipA
MIVFGRAPVFPQAGAGQLTHKRIDDLDALRKWLTVLVAPGASLGGARPKG